MPIYTPRGLRVRLSVEYAFGLMGRLYPAVDAFTVLKTTEALESIPGAIGFVTGMLCFLFRLAPWLTVAYVFSSVVAGCLITTAGLFIIPGLRSIGRVHSYLSGYGVPLITLIAVGFFTSGFVALLAYFGGRFLGGACNSFIESRNARRIYQGTGIPVTGSETNFLNAYRLHASALGITADLELSPEEHAGWAWKICFEDLAMKWPKVVSQFRTD
jgi:hypothetical protein